MITSQALFLLELHITGILFAMIFSKRLPFAFVAASGILWGGLLWVLIGIFYLTSGIGYSLKLIIGVPSVAILILGGINLKLGTWRIKQNQILILIGVLLLIVTTIVLMKRLNLTVVSSDSQSIIQLGRSFALDGFTTLNTPYVGLWGVYLPVMHSAATPLGGHFLHTFHPVLAVATWLTFAAISIHSLSLITDNKFWIISLVLLAVLLIVSMYGGLVQVVYIHTNFPSAAYLFVAVAGFWLSIYENNSAWRILSTVSLIGFSLLRTEAVPGALMFLGLYLKDTQLTYQDRIATMVPYAAIVGACMVVQLNILNPETLLFPSSPQMLTSTRVVPVLIALAGFSGVVLLSNKGWVQRYFLNNIWLAVFLGLILALLIKPTISMASINNMFLNLYNFHWWGLTLIVLIALIPILLAQPSFRGEELFTFGLIFFLMFMIALSVARGGAYRVAWSDSGNRMIMHIVPITALYVLLKLTNGFAARQIAFEIGENVAHKVSL